VSTSSSGVGRRVVVTSAGEAFAAVARQTVREFDAIAPAVRNVADVVEGHLDLVALPTLAAHPVAALIAAFRLAHPGVVVAPVEPR